MPTFCGCVRVQEAYGEASAHLTSCLQSLGRPLPTTKLDMAASLLWNGLRQLLHSLYVGRWLSHRAGGWWRRSSSGSDACNSAKDAADVYHRLHQLHLTGQAKQSRWGGVNLALCAVNMAEAAGGAMPPSMRAEIYATAAITARVHLPSPLRFLTRYLLARARASCRGVFQVPPTVKWLLHPNGHRFFVEGQWGDVRDGKSSLFTSLGESY